ncbi:MAG: hypothetical protein IJ337_04380 [Clostridia bacterium]|nr:hypothetical protein [Clostridia bacterium]
MADERETVVSRGETEAPQGPQNAKERFYEKLRMPIPVLDGIIAALVVALIVALIIGYIKGH